MRRGAKKDSISGGSEAKIDAEASEEYGGTQNAANGREVHEVFDVVKMGGEVEDELGGKREEAGWVGHG